MEVAKGKITDFFEDGSVAIRCHLPSLDRACVRQYEEVEVGFRDGRTISPEQRRKAYAILGEIAEWAGMSLEETKLCTKHDFIRKHIEGLQAELFSLSDCDMTTAREYITYLIEFVLENDVPTCMPLIEMCEDINQYVYACLMHKKCAVCGDKSELHHVDAVGMGRNRNEICHIGMESLPLCRIHHTEAHNLGDNKFMEKYHLHPIKIDDRIATKYGLRKEKKR